MMEEDDEQRLLAYYGSIATLRTEDEVGDALLVGPRLTATLVSRPAVSSLLTQGLGSGVGPTLQRHVLRSLQRALEGHREALSEQLWLAALALLASDSLEVAQAALDFVLAFASVERLRSEQTSASFHKLLSAGPVGELRSLEALVRAAASVGDDLFAQGAISLVSVAVNRLVEIMLQSNDVLTALSAIEMITQYVVVHGGTLRIFLETGALQRAAQAVGRDPIGDAALLRLAGAVAAQGDAGFRSIESGGWIAICERTLAERPNEVPESFFDGVMAVFEGIARGSDAGKARLIPLLDAIVALVRNGTTYTRVRACHCVADFLECCSTDAPASVQLCDALISSPSASGLGAKLLSMAQQPLLTDQRNAVFRLIMLLVERVPKWLHSTTPSVLPYVINRNLDTEKDAVEWRYRIAQAFVSRGNSNALELLGEEQLNLLMRFLRAGMYGREEGAKPDVAKQMG